MTEITLTQRATNIINSKAHDDNDMIQLSKIEFAMAVQYRPAMNIATEMEEEYNKMRWKFAQEARDEWKGSTEASELGKFRAELEFWWYRSLKTDLGAMKNIMSAIEWFKVSYYFREKGLRTYLDSKQN